MKSDVFREITADELKIQYDTQCKRVLGNKVILAWLLKYAVKEFERMTIGEIEKCIEGEPEISVVKVDPGETNAGKITGCNTEDSVPYEGRIYYDIRFFACLPVKQKRIKIIINVEAQKDFHPGYSIVTRGIFYGARLISSQLGTEFSIPDYDGIKKVYSIWICMNAPKYIGNAVSEYRLHKNDLVPGVPDRPDEYDKISIVMICLNRKTKNSTLLTELLNVLLSTQIQGDKKAEILEDKFKINMEDGLGKELNLMCNLSEYVEEKGIEKGIQKGQKRVNELNIKLAEAGRTEDIIRASADKEYQERLFQEYGI